MSATQDMRTPLPTALALAEDWSIPVFPCASDKKPRTAHGFKDATTHRDQICAWWDAWPDSLVGVPTGETTNLLVIDIDPKGVGWYETNRDQLGHPRVHRTLRKGFHLLYAFPKGGDLRNSAGVLAEGVDVRGNGGYVIWWPASGLVFDDVGLDELPPAPPWLLEDLARPTPKDARPDGAAQGNGEKRFVEGERHGALLREASRLRYAGAGEEAILAHLRDFNSRCCDPPQDDTDVVRIAADYAKKDARAAHDDSPAVASAEIRAAIVADLEAGPAAIDAAQPPRWVVYPLLPVAGANLAGPGATSKTTVVLSEKVYITCGHELYGHEVRAQGACVLVTAEDGATHARYLLQQILRDGVECGAMPDRAAARAKHDVRIVGWPRARFGPIVTVDELGGFHRAAVYDLLLELLTPLAPVYVTLDPAVLFSPGERYGNDGDAFLAAMLHESAQSIGACIQVIDHVSQAVARNGIIDQYAARGGTAKTDNARLARQLVRVRPDDSDIVLPLQATPQDLAEGRLLQLHTTKNNFAPKPPVTWLRRHRYWIEQLRAPSAEELAATGHREREETLLADVGIVVDHVRAQLAIGDGIRLTKRALEAASLRVNDGAAMPRQRVREAVGHAIAKGRLIWRPLPTSECHGGRKAYLAPAEATA
jgi:hypothetical protein